MRRISAIQFPAVILLFCAIAAGLVAQTQTVQPERLGQPNASVRDSSTMPWARSTPRTPTMAQRWQTDGAILSTIPSTISISGRTP